MPAFGSSIWNPDAISDEPESLQRNSKKSKRKRKKGDESDEDNESASKRTRRQVDEESDSSNENRQKSKRKRSKDKSDSDSDIHRRKKKKNSVSSDESENDDQPVKKVKKHVSSDDSSSSDFEYLAPKSKRSLGKSQREHSPVFDFFDKIGGGTVYRALPEVPTSLGLMETPCGPCPSFEFCKDGGPVNPQDCIYYSDWLSGQTLANEV